MPTKLFQPAIAFIATLLQLTSASGAASSPQILEDAEQIRISTPTLESVIRKKGYVTGIFGGTFLDRKSGFRDAGFGLDIVDWLMEPGSDRDYLKELPGDLPYEFGNLYHGKTAK